MNDEYASNPHLAQLAEELRILNDKLTELKLPESVRLDRMRSYAEASQHIAKGRRLEESQAPAKAAA